MNALSPFIGIDFGTTNSKMAWYNPKTNEAAIIMNAEGEPETPSVVYFGKDETLVGGPALEMLEYEEERERVIISIKRELTATPIIALPGRSVKPVEVAAEILRKLKRDAEERHFHQQVTRAVVTYPASFGPLDRDKIREATRLAGFTEMEMVEEPVVAAIAYTQMGLQVGRFVLVYDLGGGTFDLAVLAREDDGLFRPALEPQGINRCGGDDFDEALYNYCDGIAREKLGRPISRTEEKRDLHFLQECRKRKENLSNAERHMFNSLLSGDVIFRHEITRATFESLIGKIVEETVRKTKLLLEQASAERQAIDTIVLIGGSSRVPLVKRLLEGNLPLKPLQWQYQDAAVALGAAYYAQNKWGGLEAEKTPRKPEDFTLACTITGHTGVVTSVAISPDGQMLASGSADSSIKLWNAHTGELLHILQGHSNGVRSVGFSSDRQTLVSGSGDMTIKVWNLQSGELLRTLTGHTSGVSSVAVSSDGQTLVSGSGGWTIKVWNLQSGELLRTLTGHTSGVSSVAVSSDGQTLVSGSDDKTIKVWNLQSGELLRTLTGHTGYVRSVAISSDGQMLASGSRDQTIKLWNPRTGELLLILTGHSGGVECVAIGPDGQTLASGSRDQTIKLWTPAQAEAQVSGIATPSSSPVVQTSPVVMPSTLPSTLPVSPPSPPKQPPAISRPLGAILYAYRGHSGRVNAVAWSPDGKRIASASHDKTVQVWDATTGSNLITYHGHSSVVRAVAWSPDGKLVASASHDKTVQVWRADRGSLVTSYTDHARIVEDIAWSPNGKDIVSVSPQDTTVRVWIATTGRKVLIYDGHVALVDAVAWSPDGTRIASASHDGTLQVWSALTGHELCIYLSDYAEVTDITWSPESRRIAIASLSQKTVKVWDVTTRKEALTYFGHLRAVRSVMWSPDGKRIASGGDDNTVQVWDAANGGNVYTYRGHSNYVQAVAWSPDGKYIASGGDDNTVQVWVAE